MQYRRFGRSDFRQVVENLASADRSEIASLTAEEHAVIPVSVRTH